MMPQTQAFLAAADEALSDANVILKVNVPRQAARLAQVLPFVKRKPRKRVGITVTGACFSDSSGLPDAAQGMLPIKVRSFLDFATPRLRKFANA